MGLDPLIDRLPSELLKKHGLSDAIARNVDPLGDTKSCADAILSFGSEVIDAIAAFVPAIKINIAFFEPFYADGIRAYHQLVQAAQDKGLIVIGDVKRADIGHTSMQYAMAQLGGRCQSWAAPEAITINPYFGFDGVSPFVEVASEQGKGLFVLVQTSNPSAAEVQGMQLNSGGTLCQHVGKLVQEWASAPGLIGESGYSSIGAVVSPRDVESTMIIRELMPNCIFLVPGFGAQGRTQEEVAKCFKPDGTGALVTASRSVIYAYNDKKYAGTAPADWRQTIRHACEELVGQIRSVSKPT